MPAKKNEILVSFPASLTKVAAKESSRYAVRGILVKPVPGGGVVALATDGRKIVTLECGAEGDWPEDAEKSYLLPADALWRARDKKQVHLRIDKDGARAVHGLGETLIETEEGTFPPHEDILPRNDDKVSWIAFNADFLRDMAEAMRDNDPESTGPRIAYIGITAAHKPIMVYSRNGIGMLMPVNMEHPGHRPPWRSLRERLIEGVKAVAGKAEKAA